MDGNNIGISSVFSFLPEGCISNIISFTSPKEACKASVISVGFKSASESDTVWKKFLPSDYKEIISKSVSSPLNYATKKELYFHLCHYPILINDGTLSFWLSKSGGKKCYMICARELSIAWKDTPRYWSWTSIPESRFPEVAELLEVCWLDIRGKMQTKMLSLNTIYSVYLVCKTTENSYGLETVVKASVGFAGGSSVSSSTSSSTTSTSDHVEQEGDSIYLKIPTYVHDLRYGQRRPMLRHRRVLRPRPEHQIDGRVPRQRNDGWMEIFLGEFFSNEGDGEIEMQVSETKILNCKGGLIVEGIELRPKEDA
ncbi:hypothetical protein ACH5RR_032762 [Cinchona calisaya]|uniref:F-box domain-containing protein n=1 Tax=Cinchona calisaya TaxID=153742 RepID=A0ABD2YJ18_9GENT